MGYVSVDHWGGIRHASCLWKVSITDVPGRLVPGCCQRSHRKSEPKAVINLYRKLLAFLLL